MSDLAEYLLPKPPERPDSWRWGTVTAVSPLRVRLDGDSAALDLTPDALGPVRVDDRVWCQIAGRRVVVHPRNPGPVAMSAGIAQGTTTAASNLAITVTFPADRFSATPVVTTSMLGAPGGSQKFTTRYTSATAAGITVLVYAGDGTTLTAGVDVQVAWQAIQMTPSSGVG